MTRGMYAKVAGVWEKVFPPELKWNSATGGTVVDYVEDGVPWRAHLFNANDTFFVIDGDNYPFEYLIVGAGGTSGRTSSQSSGGGGGGQVRSGFLPSLPKGDHPVVVGQPSANTAAGGQGGSSTAFGITAVGGGLGGGPNVVGGNGGSGGGGGGGYGGTVAGGTGTSGKNGGSGNGSTSDGNHASGGGGGGASTAGGNGTTGVGGAGGVGLTSKITGTALVFGSGGGGGKRGAGTPGTGGPGAGNGGINRSGTAGTANRGGGGGGSGDNSGGTIDALGAMGGSGFIAVRYQSGPAVPVIYNDATGGTISEIEDYNGTGKRWRVHTFTASGTLTVTSAHQPFRVFLNGGGGGGAGFDGNWHGNGGSGGFDTQNDEAAIPVGAHAVTVGGGGGYPGEGTWATGGTGGESRIGTLFVAAGGAGGAPPGVNNGNYGGGASNGGTTTIRGTSESFGGGGPADAWPGYSPGTNTGNGGGGGHTGRGDPGGPRNGTGGAAGIVIVAYEVEAPQFNVASGGTVTDVTNYNGTGETWRVHTFTGNGNFVATQASHPFRLLVVAPGGTGGTGCPNGSGGAGGGGGAYEDTQAPIAVGTTAVVVGASQHSNGDYYPNVGPAGNSSFGTIVCGGGGSGGTGAWSGKKPEGGGSGGAAGSGGGVSGGAGTQGTTDRAPASNAQGGEPAHAARGGLTSDITGTSVAYSVGGGGNDGWAQGNTAAGPGSGGGAFSPQGGPSAQASRAGVVIVAYRIA